MHAPISICRTTTYSNGTCNDYSDVKIKTLESKRYARKRYASKRISHGCLVQIKKSVPRDHYLASLGKASLCQTLTLRRIFLSAPHTHERFLYSCTGQSRGNSCQVCKKKIILGNEFKQKNEHTFYKYLMSGSCFAKNDIKL